MDYYFRNLYVIYPKHDDQKIKGPLSVYCLIDQSLRNIAISVADYFVSQDIDVLALTEAWLGTDTAQLTIDELVPAG